MQALRLAAVGLAAVLCHAEDNPRWEFLRSNLQVFPGTDKLFEADPKLFWRLRSNLSDVKAAERLPDREYPFSVSTDSAGRRRHRQIKDPKSKILFLGDSCTFGIPVSDRESFPSLVQDRLGDAQCINAGVPGYSAFQGRVLLESITQQADIVVITFWPNDRSVWDQLSDPEHAELIEAERAGEFSRLRVLRLLRRAGPSNRRRLNEEEFADQIRRLVRACVARRMRPLLLIWPAKSQMDQALTISHQEVLRQIAREDGVAQLDLVPIFRSRKESSLFADSVHATRQGYGVVADAVAPVLERLMAKRQ
jgi:lysophospholipase L1-like esterase